MEELIAAKETVISEKDESPEQKLQKFTPKGAIAFFILFVLLGLFIWFSIYYLMLTRV
jgi:cell division septal protein FtsQ